MRSPSSSNSQHGIVFTMCIPRVTPQALLSKAQRNRQHLLLLKSKQNPPSTGYRASWTSIDGPATWNILLTGSVTGWRKDDGWPGMMFWIPPFLPSSIRTTLTSLHPEGMASPVAIVGRLELLSGNQSAQSPQTTLTRSQSPDY